MPDIGSSRPSAGSVDTVPLSGEFDYSNAHEISDAVYAALGRGAAVIVLDLDGVDFFSAAALGALVRSRNTCRRHGSRLGVVRPPPWLRRLLTVTGLDSLLEMPSNGHVTGQRSRPAVPA